MKIPIYIVDAFGEKLFTGNPAAVCPLKDWIPNQLMQDITAENNLSETAFFVKKENHFSIRWFTPKAEVDLAGHPTLATAHVLFRHLGFEENEITFHSNGGILRVRMDGDLLILNFPTDKILHIETPEILANAFAENPIETYQGKDDYLLIFENQKQIEEARPALDLIAQGGKRGTIISAPGNEVDFVSRYFAPQYGINEDPVTGSAHTTLIPYWFNKTGKAKTKAMQLSERKGWLNCHYLGDRVEIAGKAFTYSIGTILL